MSNQETTFINLDFFDSLPVGSCVTVNQVPCGKIPCIYDRIRNRQLRGKIKRLRYYWLGSDMHYDLVVTVMEQDYKWTRKKYDWDKFAVGDTFAIEGKKSVRGYIMRSARENGKCISTEYKDGVLIVTLIEQKPVRKYTKKSCDIFSIDDEMQKRAKAKTQEESIKKLLDKKKITLDFRR